MAQCEDRIVQMNLYLDGELDPREAAGLLTHMESCAQCRKRFEGLRIAAYETRRLAETMPAGLHEAIMQSVREAGAQKPEKPAKRALWKKPVFSVAALAAVLAVVVLAVSPSLRPGGAKDGGMSADQAPQAPAQAPRTIGPESAQAQLQAEAKPEAEGAAPADSAGEGAERSEPDQASNNNMVMALSGEEEEFVMPKLSITGKYGFYLVATGGSGVPELLPQEQMVTYPDQGETYYYVENTPETRDAVAQALEEAGYTLHPDESGKLEVSDEAAWGLVVLLR